MVLSFWKKKIRETATRGARARAGGAAPARAPAGTNNFSSLAIRKGGARARGARAPLRWQGEEREEGGSWQKNS